MRSGVSRIMTDLTAPVKPLPAVELSIHVAPPRFNAGFLGNSPPTWTTAKKEPRPKSQLQDADKQVRALPAHFKWEPKV
jgi:hypothetical protein